MRMLLLATCCLAGCSSLPVSPRVVEVPVPVQAVCPRIQPPAKPDMSALVSLKVGDSAQHIINVLTDSLRALAQDDLQLRALIQGTKP